LKEIDKKRKSDLYIKEVYDFIKAYNFNEKNLIIQANRININSIACGWGESVCLLLRLLITIYLFSAQFSFKIPKFDDLPRLESAENFQEVELIEENTNNDQLLNIGKKNANLNVIPNGEINEDEDLMKNTKKTKEGKNSAISRKSGK
jgi:hypothetical protein